MSKNTTIELKVAEKKESASQEEYNTGEDTNTLDDSEINELIEYMEADDSSDVMTQHLDAEDDDSEVVQRLYVNPKHIVPKAKASKHKPMRVIAREEIEEDEGPRGRWLVTGCRSCGDMVRFRSDQPKPLTCGKPQCVQKFEERNKNKAV